MLGRACEWGCRDDEPWLSELTVLSDGPSCVCCSADAHERIRAYRKLGRLPHRLYSAVFSGGGNLLLAMPSVSFAGGCRVLGRSICTWLPSVAASLHVHPCLPLPCLPHFGWCTAAQMDLSLPCLIGRHFFRCSDCFGLDDGYAASLMGLFFRVSWTATGNYDFFVYQLHIRSHVAGEWLLLRCASTGWLAGGAIAATTGTECAGRPLAAGC